MLLAMKIKIAITLAALASPVALTVAPVDHGTRRRRIYRDSQPGRFSIGWPATFPATASRRKRRCATW